MKIATYSDVRDHLRSHLSAAALGTAIEIGLFWRLADAPGSAAAVARDLGIPLQRCRHWLEILVQMGLLDVHGEQYGVSAVGRAAIIDQWTRETWSLLAQFEREYFPAGMDLAVHIRQPGSTWMRQGLAHPDYVQAMREDLGQARRFTRMLYEIHQSLARELVPLMDLSGVRRLVDVGGGSGVISLALLDLYPELHATVVEIPNVCVAGREIAAEVASADRIVYHPVADILRDDLPGGFDAVLVCDTGFQDEASLARIAQCLNADGRFFVIEPVVSEGIAPSLGSAVGAFRQSMHEPGFERSTDVEMIDKLRRAGLRVEFSEDLPAQGLVFIRACK